MHVQQMRRAIARGRKRTDSHHVLETLKVVEALQTDWTKRDIDVEYALARHFNQDVDVERWYFVTDYRFQRGLLENCTAVYVPQFSTPSQKKIPPACGLPRKNLMSIIGVTCPARRNHERLLICRCRRWATSGDNRVQKGRSVELFGLCLSCMAHTPHDNERFEDWIDSAISPFIYPRPS